MNLDKYESESKGMGLSGDKCLMEDFFIEWFKIILMHRTDYNLFLLVFDKRRPTDFA